MQVFFPYIYTYNIYRYAPILFAHIDKMHMTAKNHYIPREGTVC